MLSLIFTIGTTWYNIQGIEFRKIGKYFITNYNNTIC